MSAQRTCGGTLNGGSFRKSAIARMGVPVSFPLWNDRQINSVTRWTLVRSSSLVILPKQRSTEASVVEIKVGGHAVSYQLSLRLLFIIVSIAGAGLAFIGNTIHVARMQGVAEDALIARGWRTNWHNDPPHWAALVSDRLGVSVDDAFVPSSIGYVVTSEDIEDLSRLSNLRTLTVYDRCTDATLEDIACLSTLQEFIATGSPITDEGVKHLKNLPHLKYLDLSDTLISDQGILSLAELKDLETLKLRGTAVGEECLKVVVTFHKLTVLDVSNTRISDKSLAHLRSAIEGVLIINDDSQP